MKKPTPLDSILPALCVGLLIFAFATDAQSSTVTWTGEDRTWTEPDADSFDGEYKMGDNVVFSGEGQGTVKVTEEDVFPGNMTLEKGTYEFTGGAINATAIILSGGVLQWTSTQQLGWGEIRVIASSTLQSMAERPTEMYNSITVDDGVKFTIIQSSTHGARADVSTLGPISGGSKENPITLNFTASEGVTGHQHWRLSPSTFTGDIVIRESSANRLIFERFEDDHFGDPENILRILGGGAIFELPSSREASEIVFRRDVQVDNHVGPAALGCVSSNHTFVMEGKLTQAFGEESLSKAFTLHIVSPVRLMNPESHFEWIAVHSQTPLELGYLPESGVVAMHGGGEIGGILRFLGDLQGETGVSLRGMGNLSTVIEVVSADANIVFPEPLGSIRLLKEGAGTLTLGAGGDFKGHAMEVGSGTLNLLGLFFDVHALGVSEGGALSGDAEIAFSEGEGKDKETLPGGVLRFADGSKFLSRSGSGRPAPDVFRVAGNVQLSGNVELVLEDILATQQAFPVGTSFSLLRYEGTWEGEFSVEGTVLRDEAVFRAGPNSWKIEYHATEGGSNYAGTVERGGFVNLTAVNP